MLTRHALWLLLLLPEHLALAKFIKLLHLIRQNLQLQGFLNAIDLPTYSVDFDDLHTSHF